MNVCINVTRLLSDASERPLTREENHAIEQHFKICAACRRCAEQFTLLHRVMKGLRQTRLD